MAPERDAGGREALERILKRPPHELLFQLGGALAMLLGLVAFGVQAAQGIEERRQATVALTLLVDLILGGGLLVSAVLAQKSLANGAILGGAVGLVLALYGGQAGVIGGVLGILGAVVALARPYLPRGRT